MYCHPGKPVHDPAADRQLMDALKQGLKKGIPYEELDLDINDHPFVDRVLQTLFKMMGV